MSILGDMIRTRAEFAETNRTTGRSRTAKTAGNALVIVALLALFFCRSDVVDALVRLLIW